MGGKGFPPKDPDQRRRTNPEHRETLPAANDQHPALPDADGYRVETRRWYETWARSPQASRFISTDWQRLHMLAPLVDSYFASPTVTLVKELRLQESLLGATVIDRARLRWDVPKDGATESATAPKRETTDERRNRLRVI